MRPGGSGRHHQHVRGSCRRARRHSVTQRGEKSLQRKSMRLRRVLDQRCHAVAITGLRYTFTLLPFVTVPSFHESGDFNATVVKAVYKFADGL